MPIISTESAYGIGSDILLPVTARMVYPQDRDNDKRRSWLAAVELGKYVHGSGEVPVPKDLLTLVQGFVQAPRRILKDASARMPRASVAGLLLNYMLVLHEHHPRHCRVERAIATLQEIGSEPGIMPQSESSAQKAWAEFKPVAHFWAASITSKEAPWSSGLSWAKFLQLSEGFRRLAEAARLVDPKKVWRLPKSLDLPPISIHLPEPPADIVEFLDATFPD